MINRCEFRTNLRQRRKIGMSGEGERLKKNTLE
jgi:hypothetical protein